VFVIDALARLVALSAGLVATGRRNELAVVWLGTVVAIAGSADPATRARLSEAVRRSTDDRDSGGFDQLAAELIDPPDLVAVLA